MLCLCVCWNVVVSEDLSVSAKVSGFPVPWSNLFKGYLLEAVSQHTNWYKRVVSNPINTYFYLPLHKPAFGTFLPLALHFTFIIEYLSSCRGGPCWHGLIHAVWHQCLSNIQGSCLWAVSASSVFPRTADLVMVYETILADCLWAIIYQKRHWDNKLVRHEEMVRQPCPFSFSECKKEENLVPAKDWVRFTEKLYYYRPSEVLGLKHLYIMLLFQTNNFCSFERFWPILAQGGIRLSDVHNFWVFFCLTVTKKPCSCLKWCEKSLCLSDNGITFCLFYLAILWKVAV